MVKNWQPVLSRIRAALMRRGRSRQDADDLVQEAWVRLASYEQRSSVIEPEAFLMRTALNLSIDDHRMARNHGEQVLLEDVEIVDATPTAETILLARERIVRLSESLAGLDVKTRRIFLAHRVDGLSYEQIAKDLRISISAVEKHIARATLRITRDMEGWWP
jgi:RNA polymerase sigma-70 factor (ECF subfamily)